MSGATVVFIFKVLSLFFSLVFFFLILVVESRHKRLKRALSGTWEKGDAIPSIPAKAPLQKRWEGVLHKVELKREADYKAAVMEADAIVEEVFQKLGFPSLDVALGQKKITEEQLVSAGVLSDVHKRKVKLAADANAPLTQQEARYYVSIYRDVLKELEVID